MPFLSPCPPDLQITITYNIVWISVLIYDNSYCVGYLLHLSIAPLCHLSCLWHDVITTATTTTTTTTTTMGGMAVSPSAGRGRRRRSYLCHSKHQPASSFPKSFISIIELNPVAGSLQMASMVRRVGLQMTAAFDIRHARPCKPARARPPHATAAPAIHLNIGGLPSDFIPSILPSPTPRGY